MYDIQRFIQDTPLRTPLRRALLVPPQRALEATISVTATPQADGSVHATATGSFASCVVCEVWNVTT